MGLFQTVFRGSDEMYFKAEEELNAVIAELTCNEAERLCAVGRHFGELRLHHADGCGDEQRDDNGTHQISPTQYAHGHEEQDNIDDEVSVAGREPCQVVRDGGDAGHAPAHYLIGQQEGGVANRVDDCSQKHLQVVACQLPGRRSYDVFEIQGLKL